MVRLLWCGVCVEQDRQRRDVSGSEVAVYQHVDSLGLVHLFPYRGRGSNWGWRIMPSINYVPTSFRENQNGVSLERQPQDVITRNGELGHRLCHHCGLPYSCPTEAICLR